MCLFLPGLIWKGLGDIDSCVGHILNRVGPRSGTDALNRSQQERKQCPPRREFVRYMVRKAFFYENLFFFDLPVDGEWGACQDEDEEEELDDDTDLSIVEDLVVLLPPDVVVFHEAMPHELGHFAAAAAAAPTEEGRGSRNNDRVRQVSLFKAHPTDI